jgi:hypothetical protein
MAHVRGHRLYAAFLLSCRGLRRGEVLGLQLLAVVLTGARDHRNIPGLDH